MKKKRNPKKKSTQHWLLAIVLDDPENVDEEYGVSYEPVKNYILYQAEIEEYLAKRGYKFGRPLISHKTTEDGTYTRLAYIVRPQATVALIRALSKKFDQPDIVFLTVSRETGGLPWFN
jgi:hypothetical protein